MIVGKTVAYGKVTVIGENMGLRITAMLVEAPHDSFPRTTGSALAPGYTAEIVKDYNFRMPDRFTKRAIMRTADIHLDFIRGWQSRFPELTGWKAFVRRPAQFRRMDRRPLTTRQPVYFVPPGQSNERL